MRTMISDYIWDIVGLVSLGGREEVVVVVAVAAPNLKAKCLLTINLATSMDTLAMHRITKPVTGMYISRLSRARRKMSMTTSPTL